MATTLVKVYMWKVFDAARALYPGIRLKVYSDDILLQWIGRAGEGRFVRIEVLIQAVKHYGSAIRTDLEALLNTNKTWLISSNKKVLKMLAEELRGLGVGAGKGCRLLGLDYACGRRGTKEVKDKRKKKAYKKCRRIGRLKRIKADTGDAVGNGSGAQYFVWGGGVRHERA